MASSSTSPPYHIYINHCARDVKNGIASHIYRRPIGHGLKVFLDKPEMQEGEPITPQIKRANFSKGYADSKWCLSELIEMLETVEFLSIVLSVIICSIRFSETLLLNLFRVSLRNHRCRSMEMSETYHIVHEHPTIVAQQPGAVQLDFSNSVQQPGADRIGLDQTISQTEETPHIVHEHPTIVVQQSGEVQHDPHHHIIHVEAQQSGAVQLDPHHYSIQDRSGLDQTILQTEDAYSKVLKITSTIYKLFLSFYGIMQVGILTAVFSSQQRKELCKDSWGLLVLSAIVSGGVLIAFLWKYCEQFLLLRRGRRLIQELNLLVGHSSGISADDLEINRKYWSWITERAAIVIAFMTLSICLWLSCKSRLSC